MCVACGVCKALFTKPIGESTTLLATAQARLTAQVTLALAHPGDYAVWALETDGTRAERVPSEVRDGKLCFTASVKGPHGARMLYEVAK